MNFKSYKINAHRIRSLNDLGLKEVSNLKGSHPVIYWMSRDQRLHDNWALLRAQQIALELQQPLVVVFSLVPAFLEATERQYSFMLQGLAEVQKEAHKYGIGFELLFGDPLKTIPDFITKHRAVHLITDFSPLRVGRKWRDTVAKKVSIPFEEVDAHNIVPAWHASVKQEFAAYTIRPKIHRLLPEFMESFPSVKKHSPHWKNGTDKLQVEAILKKIKVDTTVSKVNWIKAGSKAGEIALKKFVALNLKKYDDLRNNPTMTDGQSNLSPYLHFGQLSAQRIALAIKAAEPSESTDSFLEELIVRRELSDNFCLYNKKYDSFEGFPGWAKRTLNEHRDDDRPICYSKAQFEHAQTHDDLWNACQLQMTTTGKMHGWMRMYWAKKILEWTRTPDEAMKIAIYLNDKYELDGRDPNGYVGIAWSIGGVHDRAWGERPIFGKVRFMSYNGAKSKFKIKDYIAQQGSQSTR